MRLNRFTLMDAHQTINSGLNTILIAAVVVLAPLCIFLVVVSVYFDISKIYGGFILTLGAILFFAGLIGFSTKFMSDSLSIGLNLNSKARGDLPLACVQGSTYELGPQAPGSCTFLISDCVSMSGARASFARFAAYS